MGLFDFHKSNNTRGRSPCRDIAATSDKEKKYGNIA